MKKIFYLTLFMFAMLLANINAQEYYEGEYEFAFGDIQIAEGLTLSATEEGYRIEYEIPQFYEDYVVVGGEGFSVLKFENDNDFFEMAKVGRPSLPFKSLNLQIPLGTEMVVPIINYDVYYEDFEEYNLAYPYLPAQDAEKRQESFDLCIDHTFYESDEWQGLIDGGVEISEPYNYLGSTGITVNLYPVAYNPGPNIARIPSRIIVEIPNLSLNELTVCHHSLFDTYWRNYSNWDRTLFKGDLAIFTHSDYESALESYVEYKRNCGYRVNIYPDENNSNWSDPAELRNKIKEIYDESNGQDLDYVLIVGAPIQIPYSVGVLNVPEPESADIPTDIYYACLEHDNIEEEPLDPDIMVGRWPVMSEQDVINIVEKTIRFEEIIGRSYQSAGRVALFSGINDYAYWFAQDINTFANILENYNLPVTKYDGRDLPDDEMFYLLNDELYRELWMMIFSGHGCPYSVTLTKNYLEYDQMSKLTYSDLSPISFFFACSTNRYPNPENGENYTLDKTFAMQWIVEQNRGGVASFGSTTISNTYSDHQSGKAIFKHLKRQGTNMHLADWTQSAMQRYYKAHMRTIRAKNQFKRYVLMGDPTLYIYGTDWNYNPIIQYASQSEQENKKTGYKRNINLEVYPTIANDYVVVNTSEDIESLQITNLNGEVVYNSDNVTDNTTIPVSSLPESIYFIVAQTNCGDILNKKFIVQH